MVRVAAEELLMLKGGFLLWATAALLGAGEVSASPVLLISVDGLRPADVLEAEGRGIAVPNLRAMMKAGVYADGVTGVTPTLTYPSHTTLITGVSPARHGVANNLTFDPLNINQIGWDWYAVDIRVPTLWSAAKAAGLRTANVHWPVSVGAPVDANLPQIWRTGHEDDRKLLTALATPGLVAHLESAVGAPYPQGIDESVEADETRVRFAERLLTEQKPALTTVYLASVDHNEHAFGPGSPEAKAVIARNDAMIGRLAAAARAAEPDVTVVVVSDHGFEPIHTDVNIIAPFIAAGLIRIDSAGKVTGWDAEPWLAGGTAAIVLARRDDVGLQARVKAVLDRLAADPALGIDRVLDRADIARLGGTSRARYWLAFRPGFEAGHDPKAPPTSPSSYKGMHGYLPTDPGMRSVLIAAGPGVHGHGDLGQIDMRAIAPSVARILGVSLPGAEAKPAF
jgi:predicted AlkP superfamily pyrophosphatase or phosphodiesterase